MAAFLGLPSCSLSDLFPPPLVIVKVIQSPETLHTSADVIVFQTLVPFCTAVLHHTQLYQCEKSLYGDFGPALRLRNLQLGPVLRGLQGSCSACCRPAQQSLAHPVIQNPQVAFLPGIRLWYGLMQWESRGLERFQRPLPPVSVAARSPTPLKICLPCPFSKV